MRTAVKQPPVFGQRQAAWEVVMKCMDKQLLFLPAHLADRVGEIRRWLALANVARRSERATVGITIEHERHHKYVDVWVSEPGRSRPSVSIILPLNMLWRQGHENYLSAMTPVYDERTRIVEEDEWLS